MYPEVSCPSILLYSIYTGQEAQCNITNNYTQSILPTLLLNILALSLKYAKVFLVVISYIFVLM
jgi:hypothetical protein